MTNKVKKELTKKLIAKYSNDFMTKSGVHTVVVSAEQVVDFIMEEYEEVSNEKRKSRNQVSQENKNDKARVNRKKKG